MSSNISATHNTTVSLASSTTVTGAVTKYQFWSADSAAGHLIIGGVKQDYDVEVDFTLSDFASAVIDIGNALAPVTDYIRAYDGSDWSGWASFTVTATANTAPTVTSSTPAAGVIGTHNPLSSIFSFADADGDAIKGVYIWVGNGTTNHGHLYVDGMDQVHETSIYLTIDQFNRADYDNTLDGTSVLWAKPSDGYSTPATWGTGVTMLAATSPTMSAHSATVSYGGATLANGIGTDAFGANVIASYADADGDPAVLYLIWDDSSNSGANGHLLYNGTELGVGQNMEFTPSQMADVTYQATGASDTTDSLWTRAWDGGQWGAWNHVVETAGTEHVPTVTASGTSTNVAVSSSTAVSSFFIASDADGTSFDHYRFWDSSDVVGSGHLTIGGIAQHAGAWIDVTDLSSVYWDAATAGMTDMLYIQAIDPMQQGFGSSLSLSMSAH